ncbi:hypothetical protein BKA66DRAFT_475925 [Pyrenochaeta sp. MPI-SDFR-AT-0127]|nr:hypothetical protein BKA66DRAFT_475925 [Pyrenochaeta sp. MPI-SDFR-AT-0127]
MTSYQNAVCDSCKLRKVRCDRDDPCGNCVDGNISCLRTLASVRHPRNASKRHRVTESATAQSEKSRRRKKPDVSSSPSIDPQSVSQSPSIIEAQDFIQRQIGSAQYMSTERLEVLNAAMSFVNHLLRATKPDNSSDCVVQVVDVLDGITYPSVELLYWMIRELKGSNIGPHVLDFFKHVSPKSLKTMGLALIDRAGRPETLLLYSICVNSAAFKFINTVLSGSGMEAVEDGMRVRAATYLSSVKVAMARIQLLSNPSLLFLQSLLCSAFIAQGIGDSTACWTFISAACRVCEDIDLYARVKAGRAESEDDEEIFYCYIWCHLLDKNYSMMLGRTRCLLEYKGMDLAFSHPYNRSMSALLMTYLHFVPIQDLFVTELHPAKILNDESLVSRVELVVHDLLERLQRVHARITALHGPSDSWDGLHSASELNTIQFSYHSLRTSILRSRQICFPGKPHIDADCLTSARMAMVTLRAIQESSITITDIRSHIAYMHWTALYHPLTPFFVLFCNVVATSNKEDFQTLKLVTSQLDDLVDLSSSIAKLQALFKAFVGLCSGLITKDTNIYSPLLMEENQTPQKGRTRDPAITSHPVIHACNEQTYCDKVGDTLSPQQPSSNIPILVDLMGTPVQDIPEFVDPSWGFFDIQPTLSWLDADFSYFDSNQ